MSAQIKLLLLALATFLVGAVALTNQSFWIDEGAAAMKAVQPTLHAWWSALRTEGHSNLQLLPHLFLLWGWEKIFGSSEIALRALNVPLLLLGLLAAHWGLQFRPRLQWWFPLLVLVNSFTWYYTSEARPYILLFAVSCLPLACLLRAFDRPEACRTSHVWFACLCVGVFLVSAVSLVAVPWALAWTVAALLLLGWRPMLQIVREHLLISLVSATAMVALALYYLWTLSLGAGASPATTGIANLFFVFYEQLGLLGLGPDRSALRARGLSVMRPYVLPLALGVAALIAVSIGSWRSVAAVCRDRRSGTLLLIAAVLPLLAVLCAGYVMNVRILGRHVATFFPFVIFGLAAAMDQLTQQRSLARRAAAIALPVVLLASALQIRFAPRHARDDYRSAAMVARAALEENRSVWWAADEGTGLYYQVPIATSTNPAGAIHLISPTAERLAGLPAADVIVLSKRDVYDLHGSIGKQIGDREMTRTHTFQSFEIFARR